MRRTRTLWRSGLILDQGKGRSMRGSRRVSYREVTPWPLWTTRGNKALRVELKDGKTVYLGSDKPERLLGRIATAVGRRYEWV